jgi:hypothetical protein
VEWKARVTTMFTPAVDFQQAWVEVEKDPATSTPV